MSETNELATRKEMYSKTLDSVFPPRFELLPFEGLRRWAEAFGEGATKYGEANFRKGFTDKCLLQHALMHIFAYQAGDRSEDHLGHAMWNIGMLCKMEKERPDLLELRRETMDEYDCKVMPQYFATLQNMKADCNTVAPPPPPPAIDPAPQLHTFQPTEGQIGYCMKCGYSEGYHKHKTVPPDPNSAFLSTLPVLDHVFQAAPSGLCAKCGCTESLHRNKPEELNPVAINPAKHLFYPISNSNPFHCSQCGLHVIHPCHVRDAGRNPACMTFTKSTHGDPYRCSVCGSFASEHH